MCCHYQSLKPVGQTLGKTDPGWDRPIIERSSEGLDFYLNILLSYVYDYNSTKALEGEPMRCSYNKNLKKNKSLQVYKWKMLAKDDHARGS